VIVVGGAASLLCWANALPAPTIVAPAAIARPWTSVRREMIDSGSRCTSRVIISSQYERRPVDPARRRKANPIRPRLREPLLIPLATACAGPRRNHHAIATL